MGRRADGGRATAYRGTPGALRAEAPAPAQTGLP